MPRIVVSTLVFAIVASMVLACAGPTLAQPVRTPNVEAELISEREALVPGQTTTVALRLKIRDRWHTYWQNPGDSGLPTTLEWKLPEGFRAGAIQWPAPKALAAGPLVNYGYDGEVLHLVDIDVPATFSASSPVPLSARADWLVCEDVCIPEGADLTLVMPVAANAAPNARWAAPIDAARKALPKPLTGWTAAALGEGQRVKLVLEPPPGASDPGALRFFPFNEGAIEPSGAQQQSREGARYVLSMPVAYQLDPAFKRVTGVITAARGLGDAKAATIDVALSGAVVAGPKPLDAPAALAGGTVAATSSLSLAAALMLAFGGGLLLNLMPCVFPVLSLKVMGFVEHHDAKRTMHREAVAFSIGVILSFVVLALALVGLRAAGEELGWGFQLQSPAVVAALALLFFLLALNLSGVFEFGMFVPSSAASWTAKNRTLDAFASGVLAVIVASPCTAPFMGAAVGYAISQSIAVTLAVFIALGVGMALPYALFAWFPGWRKRLPRPGRWMERLKQFLAFPLYATVAWLAWVLGAQVDNDAVFRLALALVFVAIAGWAWRAFRASGARAWAGVALAGAASMAFVIAPLFATSAASAQARATKADLAADWREFSPATVASLQASGQPVFVDFTAAWCVTCQVNKRLVLNDAEVRSAFARKNVALVRADWTRRDPQITQALAALGRNGVPVYVLYRPGKAPMLLPEVLNASLVHDALATL